MVIKQILCTKMSVSQKKKDQRYKKEQTQEIWIKKTCIFLDNLFYGYKLFLIYYIWFEILKNQMLSLLILSFFLIKIDILTANLYNIISIFIFTLTEFSDLLFHKTIYNINRLKKYFYSRFLPALYRYQPFSKPYQKEYNKQFKILIAAINPGNSCILQLYSKEKKQMFCDLRLYASMTGPQMIPKPSGTNPNQLYDVISFAIDQTLSNFLKQKVQEKAKNEALQVLRQKQEKKVQLIVIDLDSDEQFSQKNINKMVDAQQNIPNYSTLQQSIRETIRKQSTSGVKQIQVPSQTPSEISKQLELKQNQQMQQKVFPIKQSIKLPQDVDFVLFNVKCPKIGISNAQLLARKQKLYGRKITDWSEVDQKVPKQRRQIRMLKN